MIDVRNLYRAFGQKQVLRGVDVTISTGESITIIGQSGCGKSVLLKHLVGLLIPDSGQIFVDGEEITSAKRKELYEIRKKFGVLFQGGRRFGGIRRRTGQLPGEAG